MNISLRAKSSSGDPYTVKFVVENDALSVSCNCQAGQFGQLCKHKTELIAGDKTRLFDDSDASKLEELATLLSRSPEIAQIATEIAESEKIIRREQAKLKKVKKDFGLKLKEGFHVES